MSKKETKNVAPFYIALCCCVAVIGLVGYAGRLAADRQIDDEPISNASADIIQTPTSVPDDVSLIPTEPPAVTAVPKKQAYVQTSGKSVSTEPTEKPIEVIAFSQPCNGKVIAEMSADELEYNTALGDWRTHNGVDIALENGEEVKTIHSGVVVEMFSGNLGETVIIDCKNGFIAVYGCLSGTDCLTIGQELSSGYVIGTAGGVGSENITQPHLHLELIKDGNAVDPREYIEFAK